MLREQKRSPEKAKEFTMKYTAELSKSGSEDGWLF